MTLQMGTAKTYIRDQIRRYVKRMSRPVRILKGYHEYTSRRDLAHRVPVEQSYDGSKLALDGYLNLEPPTDLLNQLLATSTDKLENAKTLAQRGGKAFFSSLLSEQDYGLDSIFMQFALYEPFLNTVAHYLDAAPYLEYAELLYSKPAQGKLTASQLWHRDRTDKAIIKIFVYINDVTEENGPFTFVPRRESKVVPEYLPHYISDEQLAKYVPTTSIVSLMGKAGTTFMIDSENCYHLGSRCIKPRLAYVVYYTSGFSYQPRERVWQVTATEKANLSEIQRNALGVQ